MMEITRMITLADNTMKQIVDKIIKINFDDIKNYNFPNDEVFGLQVQYDKVLFCFIINFSSKSKNLLCFGPIARGQNELHKIPFFSRWSWYKYFEDSTLAYADPTLFVNDKLRVGWFVGGKEWYIKILAKIISELSKNRMIFNENILFFGNSAGGFSSICLGTLIKNSKVLINNSQTNLLEHSLFNELLLDALESNLEMDKEKILKKFIYRFNVYELFKKEKYAPSITYYVNVLSRRDIEIHAKLLIDGLCKLDYFNDLDVHFYSQKKEDPHHPLPVKKTIDIITDFSKNNLNNFVNIGNFKNDIENLNENANLIKTNFIEDELSYLNEMYSYLLKYGTARIDIKNKGQKNNSIEILYNSDEKSRVNSPIWFKNDEGIGFTFHTTERRWDLEIKCINDGILNIRLKGVYFKEKNDILPIYIKYNNVWINDENILKEETLVWHNKPYTIRKKVQNGDIIFISIFWEPI